MPSKLEGSILIADDHEVVRYGLVQILKKAFGRCQVHEAGCFADVERLLDTRDLKLVLCDLAMPGLEGTDQLTTLRRRRPDAKLVVLSGDDGRETVLAALAAGAHGYIVKTAGSDELVERLNYVLAGQVYVPPLVAEVFAKPTARSTPALPTAVAAVPGDGTDVPAANNGVRLSPRQLQVLAGLVRGLSNKEIARELELAEGTIKMHVGAVLRALGASNRAHAAALGHHLLG